MVRDDAPSLKRDVDNANSFDVAKATQTAGCWAVPPPGGTENNDELRRIYGNKTCIRKPRRTRARKGSVALGYTALNAASCQISRSAERASLPVNLGQL